MGERKPPDAPHPAASGKAGVMYGIVGVDFTAEDGLVEPLEKLKAAWQAAEEDAGGAVASIAIARHPGT